MGSKHLASLMIASAVVAVGFIAASASEASAQGYRRGDYRRYVPARPTFGDAFNYARDDVGLLNNYYTFVQPQRQIRAAMQQQSNQIAAQEDEIQGLQYELNAAIQAGTPTGKGGGYLNYSHFYNIGGGGRIQR